jgi:hypothetical protein
MSQLPTVDYYELVFSLPNDALESAFYSLMDTLEIVDATSGYALIRTTEKTIYTLLMYSLGSLFVKRFSLSPSDPCKYEMNEEFGEESEAKNSNRKSSQ